MTTLTISLEDDVLVALQKEPAEVAGEMRLLSAVKWYELGRISQDKAAEVAGVSRAEFVMAASHLGVSPFQETAEEILLWCRREDA